MGENKSDKACQICSVCGFPNTQLHSHHINRLTNIRILVCPKCHVQIERGLLREDLQANMSRKMFKRLRLYHEIYLLKKDTESKLLRLSDPWNNLTPIQREVIRAVKRSGVWVKFSDKYHLYTGEAPLRFVCRKDYHRLDLEASVRDYPYTHPPWNQLPPKDKTCTYCRKFYERFYRFLIGYY